MVDVGDAVGEPNHLGLERGRLGHGPGVVDDAVPDLPREVEASALVLQEVDHPQALLVVPERAAQER